MTIDELQLLTPAQLEARSKELGQEYSTPEELFEALDKEFRFQVDVSADRDGNNSKCSIWIAKDCAKTNLSTGFISDKKGALYCDWIEPGTDTFRVWCNPPFKIMAPWVEMAFTEAQKHPGAIVCMLGPNALGTQWYEEYGQFAAEVRVLVPRPKFVPPAELLEIYDLLGKKFSNSAAAETCAFIFRPNPHRHRAIVWPWRWQE